MDIVEERRSYGAEIPVKIAEPGTGLRLASLLDAQVIYLILGIKALVLIFAAQSYIVLTNRPLISVYDWLLIWNRWDALHYLNLARTGYVSEGLEARAIAFYPLYPWLVRLTTFLMRDELTGAFFVSTIASIIAGLLLHVLVQLDERAAVARATVFFMFIFPTSYFLISDTPRVSSSLLLSAACLRPALVDGGSRACSGCSHA